MTLISSKIRNFFTSKRGDKHPLHIECKEPKTQIQTPPQQEPDISVAEKHIEKSASCQSDPGKGLEGIQLKAQDSLPQGRVMMGAIIGDIVGSRFEMENYNGSEINKTKKFDLFMPECRFTDDTVMTVATMKALIDCDGDWDKLGAYATKAFREIGRRYPDCGFGHRTREWVLSDDAPANNSAGNGAAMRISPCGYMGKTIDEVQRISREITKTTHDHPDAIKGAEAVAVCVFLAACAGKSQAEIRQYVNDHYYPMDFTLDEIRKDYKFSVLCEGSVPQGIMAFLESRSTEDAIRNAISIGGDSDTLAAIAGGIAEAYYSDTEHKLQKEAMRYLDNDLRNVVLAFGEHVDATLEYARKKAAKYLFLTEKKTTEAECRNTVKQLEALATDNRYADDQEIVLYYCLGLLFLLANQTALDARADTIKRLEALALDSRYAGNCRIVCQHVAGLVEFSLSQSIADAMHTLELLEALVKDERYADDPSIQERYAAALMNLSIRQSDRNDARYGIERLEALVEDERYSGNVLVVQRYAMALVNFMGKQKSEVDILDIVGRLEALASDRRYRDDVEISRQYAMGLSNLIMSRKNPDDAAKDMERLKKLATKGRHAEDPGIVKQYAAGLCNFSVKPRTREERHDVLGQLEKLATNKDYADNYDIVWIYARGLRNYAVQQPDYFGLAGSIAKLGGLATDKRYIGNAKIAEEYAQGLFAQMKAEDPIGAGSTLKNLIAFSQASGGASHPAVKRQVELGKLLLQRKCQGTPFSPESFL